jgi:hypothetical protein
VEKIKKWWRSISFKKAFTHFATRIYHYYTYAQGGKRQFNFEKLFISGSFLLCPALIIYFFWSGENTAYIGHSPSSLSGQDKPVVATKNTATNGGYNFPVQKNNASDHARVSGSPQNQGKIEYKTLAKQVLSRENADLGYGFSAGSNLIGELQSTIDSRDPNQTVRVILPYGGKSKDGSAELPRGTLLLGQTNYPGKGEKVFIQFQQAILPTGKAIKLAAVALDPRDYSTGLVGEIQSQAKSRTLSIMGLSAVSSMGNVMTEKEAMGQYQVEAKANAKNALLTGASHAAEVEAGRLQDQTEAEDYVHVDAGTAVVVSLTQGLNQ